MHTGERHDLRVHMHLHEDSPQHSEGLQRLPACVMNEIHSSVGPHAKRTHTLSGHDTKKNVYLLCSAHAAASFSRSKNSPGTRG